MVILFLIFINAYNMQCVGVWFLFIWKCLFTQRCIYWKLWEDIKFILLELKKCMAKVNFFLIVNWNKVHSDAMDSGKTFGNKKLGNNLLKYTHTRSHPIPKCPIRTFFQKWLIADRTFLWKHLSANRTFFTENWFGSLFKIAGLPFEFVSWRAVDPFFKGYAPPLRCGLTSNQK